MAYGPLGRSPACHLWQAVASCGEKEKACTRRTKNFSKFCITQEQREWTRPKNWVFGSVNCCLRLRYTSLFTMLHYCFQSFAQNLFFHAPPFLVVMLNLHTHAKICTNYYSISRLAPDLHARWRAPLICSWEEFLGSSWSYVGPSVLRGQLVLAMVTHGLRTSCWGGGHPCPMTTVYQLWSTVHWYI